MSSTSESSESMSTVDGDSNYELGSQAQVRPTVRGSGERRSEETLLAMYSTAKFFPAVAPIAQW